MLLKALAKAFDDIPLPVIKNAFSYFWTTLVGVGSKVVGLLFCTGLVGPVPVREDMRLGEAFKEVSKFDSEFSLSECNVPSC